MEVFFFSSFLVWWKESFMEEKSGFFVVRGTFEERDPWYRNVKPGVTAE